MSSLMTLWAITQILLGISLLIFVHELGHFIVARWAGVRCEAFSIGFGPAILKYKGPETEYRLSIIPLGGYVKMAGENPGEETGADDELHSKGVGARAAIFSAGVIMNLIVSVLLFAVAFGLGVRFIKPEVGDVPTGSPAWHAGLVKGDVFVSIDGKDIINFDQIALAVAFADPEVGMRVVLEREGKRITRQVFPEYHQAQGLQWIGIYPASQAVIHVEREGPAASAGLKTGDTIVEVDGHGKVADANDLLEALSTVRGPFTVVYLRDGKRAEATVTPAGSERFVLGVVQAGVEVSGTRKFSAADGSSPSVARRLGVLEGDRLLRLGGEPVYWKAGARDKVADWPAGWGETVEVVFERKGADGKPTEFKIPKLARSEAVAFFDGIASRSHEALVGLAQEGTPAQVAGITPGSKIVEIDGQPVTAWTDLSAMIGKAAGKPLKVGWIDAKGARKDAEITPMAVKREFGFGYDFKLSDEVRYGFVQACSVGLQQSWEMSLKVMTMVKALFTRQVSPTKLGGPILIAQASYAYVDRYGFARFLYFLGLLSVNLVILNLLPIPVLDGGHLMFLGIEAIKGSPVSETAMAISHYIGFFLILALLVFVMANDILRLFSVIMPVLG